MVHSLLCLEEGARLGCLQLGGTALLRSWSVLSYDWQEARSMAHAAAAPAPEGSSEAAAMLAAAGDAQASSATTAPALEVLRLGWSLPV